MLERLRKGHTRGGLRARGRVCAATAGLALAPTFVPFTPWTTLDGYADLLATIRRLELVEAVAPIQLAIRLLVTAESALLELPDITRIARAVRSHVPDLALAARAIRGWTRCSAT